MDDLAGEWRALETVETGAELLAAATLFGRSAATDAAASFLERHREELGFGVLDLLAWYQRDPLKTKQAAQSDSDQQTVRRAIRRIKHDTGVAPRSPISFVERARLHAILGQPDAARRAMRQAVGLAPHNRFVLRAAVRWFVSQDEFDTAVSLLENVGDDPWLLASKIAVSELAGQAIQDTKRVRWIVEHGPPVHISELAASLATLELSSGGIKPAKRHFRRSALKPNENAVAQLRWANEIVGIPFDPALLSTEGSFEARAAAAIRRKDWLLAVKNAHWWMADEPFAKRPAEEGCFWSVELLRNYALAEQFASAGLLSHPSDPGLLNNRAFARANLGKLAEARADIEAALTRHPTPRTRFVLSATLGCVRFREGNATEGATLYRHAVEQARKLGDISGAKHALLHWLFEERRIGRISRPETLFQVSLAFEDPKFAPEVLRDIYAAHFGPLSQSAPTGQATSDETAVATLRDLSGS